MAQETVLFLTLMTRAFFAISTIKSVWRQRKAGICTTSSICVAASISSKRCTSERTGIFNSPFIFPGSLNLFQTGTAIGVDGSPVGFVIGCFKNKRNFQFGRKFLQVSCVIHRTFSSSSTQGPAIKEKLFIIPNNKITHSDFFILLYSCFVFWAFSCKIFIFILGIFFAAFTDSGLSAKALL